MFRRILLAAGGIAAVAAAGCGSLANQRGESWYMTCCQDPPSQPYGGVQQDWSFLASHHEWLLERPGFGHVIFGCVALIDLPLCMVADTLLLPHDAWATTVNPSNPPDASKPQEAK